MKKLKGRRLFIVVGIVAIILAICCANKFVPTASMLMETYGGDAYTGIQNAAAKTANTVCYLADVTRFGFSSVLSVMGLMSIAYGLGDIKKKEEKTILNRENSFAQPNYNVMANQQPYVQSEIQSVEDDLTENFSE